MLRDAHELMDKRTTTEDSIVIDLYFASQLGSITEDDMVTKDTVMSDMRVSHQEAITPNNRLATRSRTTIDCHAFTYHRMITDNSDAILTNELEVLGDPRDDCPRVNVAVLTQTSSTLDDGMALDDTTFPDLGILFDDGEGMDDNTFTQLSFRMDACQWAYVRM